MSEPAFPATDCWGAPTAGLTKREWFAGMAMLGILSDPVRAKRMEITDSREVARHAFSFADAMEAASKEPKP